MKYKVFVDGQEGTTGLKIGDYLSARPDIEVLKIKSEQRKDIEERRNFLNEADIVFLCLPDAAAKESVSLIHNTKTRVIDASTAHRTNDAWAYGLPELNKQQRAMIRNSARVSVPGCHATGFVLAVNPLVQQGVLNNEAPLACHSLTGYSGGGKSLINKYEQSENSTAMRAPRPYSLKLSHKHLPEMQKRANLAQPPLFTPIVANFYKGMAVSVMIPAQFLRKKLSAKEIQAVFEEYYAGERFIRVMPYESDAYLDSGYFLVEECNDTNRVDLFVLGNDEQILLIARLDNLGKGASGAAIQNMNIMLGLDEGISLKAFL